MKRKSPLPASSTRTIRRSSPKSPDWANSTKTRYKQQYQARLDNLDNARYEAESGKISGMQNMVSGVGDAFGQLAMLYGLGGFGKSGLAGITGNN